MDTPDDPAADSVLRQVLAAHRWQGSGHYLWALSRSSLAGLLATSTKGAAAPADVGRVAGLIHDLGIKGFSYKCINVMAFWAGLILMVAGIGWPALNSRFQFTTDATTAGTFQSVITAAGAFALTIHRQYKRRQTQVENALRRTLFATEGVEAKVARLLDLAPTIDTGADFSAASEPAKPKEKHG